MAYTYDDFLKTATKANMLGRFDKNDLAITKTNPDYGLSILSLMKDRDSAATPEARLLAGEAINQLRADFAYETITDGASAAPSTEEPSSAVTEEASGSTSMEQPSASVSAGVEEAPQSFSYDREAEYQKLLAAIVNPATFRYDPESDPSNAAMRKMYLREGERATQDALARAAAATGGIPSSYAVTAAQQAGANYAEQLAGLLPTLEENAYGRYLDQQEQKLNALQVLQSDRENEYAKYLAEQELAAQQEAAAQQETAAQQEEGQSGVDAGDLSYLQKTYPSGVITSKSSWDYLVSQYGEAALLAAGFRYGQGTAAETLDQPPASAPAVEDSQVTPVGRPGTAALLAPTEQLIATEAGQAMKDAVQNYFGNDTVPVETADTVFDESDIAALGLGPISAKELMKLIEAGIVEEYTENGVLKLRLNTRSPIFTAGSAVKAP